MLIQLLLGTKKKMFGLVNFNDAGELPNSDITRVEQIPYLVMRISQMLVDIKPHLKNSYMIPCYSFTVRSEYKDTLEKMLIAIEREGLPKGAEFYECDGRKVFEIRGPSGGVMTAVSFYLVAK
jgi:hypothetical protein